MYKQGKLVVISGIFASLSFFSCSEKQTGTWISHDLIDQSTVIKFEGNDIMVETVALSLSDSAKDIKDDRMFYAIEDKIVSDSNNNESLYIVKTKEGKYPKYSVIGEVSIDDKTRKFYTKYLKVVRYDSKQQIIDKLNRKMFGTIGKYLVFRDARTGETYVKEAPGKH